MFAPLVCGSRHTEHAHSQVPYQHKAGVSELYLSRGYKSCPQVHSQLGWLHLHRQVLLWCSFAVALGSAPLITAPSCYIHHHAQVHCHTLFQESLSRLQASLPAGPVPGVVPEELREEFLLGGHVNLTLQYWDQRHHGEVVPYNWTDSVLGARPNYHMDSSKEAGASLAAASH